MHFDAGKGDSPRPSSVDELTRAKNWCLIFGHKPDQHGQCKCCKAWLAMRFSNELFAPLFPERHTS